jgi:hypothetical protein
MCASPEPATLAAGEQVLVACWLREDSLGQTRRLTLVQTAGLFCLASKAFLYLDDLDSDRASASLLYIGAGLMGGGLFVLFRSESMKQPTTSRRWRTLFVVMGVSLILTVTTFAVLAKVLRRNWPGDKIRPLEAVSTTRTLPGIALSLRAATVRERCLTLGPTRDPPLPHGRGSKSFICLRETAMHSSRAFPDGPEATT